MRARTLTAAARAAQRPRQPVAGCCGAPARGLTYSLGGPRYPRSIKIFEVGPRDGLQAEKTAVPTAVKVELIDRLAAAGHRYIEATSFVSAKAIPQLGDAAEVMAGIRRAPGVTYSALVPNSKGLEGALAAGVGEVAIFTAASDAFTQRNINCNVMTSLERFKPVMAAAKAAGVPVRGYVSTALGCPYSGHVDPHATAFVARSLLDLGCYEISLGDTIGVGTPVGVRALLHCMREHDIPVEQLALHAHATYGLALANITAALEMGVRVVDASVAGLGGCPYAKGASGNVPTEDVLYLAAGLGIEVEGSPDVDAVAATGQWICGHLGKTTRSCVAQARAAHGATLVEAQRTLALGTASEAEVAKARAVAAASEIGLSWPTHPSRFFAPPDEAGAQLAEGAAPEAAHHAHAHAHAHPQHAHHDDALRQPSLLHHTEQHHQPPHGGPGRPEAHDAAAAAAAARGPHEGGMHVTHPPRPVAVPVAAAAVPHGAGDRAAAAVGCASAA